MSRAIIELNATTPGTWTFEVPPHLCTGPLDQPFLFGGSGLALCVAAMQAAQDRPPIWATAQYLAYARPGEALAIEVAETAHGRNTVQLQAVVRRGELTLITAQGAVGERPGDPFRQLIGPPGAPPPHRCRVVERDGGNPLGVDRQFEFRLIRGRFPSPGTTFDTPSNGRLQLWMRPPVGISVDAPLLAIVADYISEALSDAAGRRIRASSIDNTLRLGPIEASKWLLCDISIDALYSGVGHGQVRIYSERGVLMALGSTSLILRAPRTPHAEAPGPSLAAEPSSSWPTVI